jgi:hypothetical protein
MIIQYAHAKRAIAECLREPMSAHHCVARAIVELERRRDNGANGPLVRDDAQRCIDVIEQFQRAANELDLRAFAFAEPESRSPSLNINGVEVTVFPDAISTAEARDGMRVGEAFIRCTIGTPGDAAENRRSEANGYLATIAHLHSVQYLAHRGTPHAPTSMVIDVPRRTVTRGSPNFARRAANIDMACAMIAAVWPMI